MKQLFTALLVVISTACFSQDVYWSKTFCKGVSKEGESSWTWGDVQDVVLKFTIQNKVIMVSDKAQSVYVLGKEVPLSSTDKTIEQVGWDAIDEKGRDCFVKLVKAREDGSVGIYVMYLKYNVCFAYGGLEKESGL